MINFVHLSIAYLSKWNNSLLNFGKYWTCVHGMGFIAQKPFDLVWLHTIIPGISHSYYTAHTYLHTHPPLPHRWGTMNEATLTQAHTPTSITMRNHEWGHTHTGTRAIGSSPGVGQLIDQRGDTAKGSEIEVGSADHSAWSAGKKFRLHFQLSGWGLMALSYFEEKESSPSTIEICQLWPCGCQTVRWARHRIRDYKGRRELTQSSCRR